MSTRKSGKARQAQDAPETPAERAARLRRELLAEARASAAAVSERPGALAVQEMVSDESDRPGAQPGDAARLDHLGLRYWTILRDVNVVGEGSFWNAATVSYAEADAAVGSILEAGWTLRDVRPISYGPSGIRILWQFARGKGVDRSGVPYTEARHITRILSAAGSMGSMTGFQADALITGLVRDGWTLVCSAPMAPSGDGIPFLWVFVR